MKTYGKGDHRTYDLITLMRKQIEGKITPIQFAPSRYCLQLFGGPVSIEEFRKEIPVFMHIPGEIFQLPLITVGVKPVEGLKLKRDAPLERSKSKLEKSLGIIRKKCSAATQ
jgi:hypothetical protein